MGGTKALVGDKEPREPKELGGPWEASGAQHREDGTSSSGGVPGSPSRPCGGGGSRGPSLLQETGWPLLQAHLVSTRGAPFLPRGTGEAGGPVLLGWGRQAANLEFPAA